MYVSFPHSRQRHASNSRQLDPIFYGFLGVSDVDKLFNGWRRSVEGYEEQQQAFKELVLVHAGPGGEVTTVLKRACSNSG